MVGQIKGPFEANQNVFTSAQKVRLGISIDTKDLMPFGEDRVEGLSFKINGQLIEMGRTGMYETGDYINVSSLSFNKKTPASVIINYTTE